MGRFGRLDARPSRLVAASLGFLLIAAAWLVGALPAHAQTAPTCSVGSDACQQALLWVGKGGAVTNKVLIPGNNTDVDHNDALECHGPASGECYLAFGANGVGVLYTAHNQSCNTTPSANVTEIGGSGNKYDAMALDLANGTLYGVQGSEFGSINTSSGAFTSIGNLDGTTPSGSVGDSNDLLLSMTWDSSSGDFLAVVDHDNGVDPSRLVHINPSTGAVVQNAFGSDDFLEVTPDGGRNEVSGIVFVGGTLYAATSQNDSAGHLETLSPTSGDLTDIGANGSGIGKIRGLTADSSGQLFGLTGSAGAFVSPIPCPSPSASPSPSPSPSPVVSPTQAIRTPSPSPSILGITVKKPILPVTGINILPMLMIAVVAYLFGALALALSSKRNLAVLRQRVTRFRHRGE